MRISEIDQTSQDPHSGLISAIKQLRSVADNLLGRPRPDIQGAINSMSQIQKMLSQHPALRTISVKLSRLAQFAFSNNTPGSATTTANLLANGLREVGDELLTIVKRANNQQHQLLIKEAKMDPKFFRKYADLIELAEKSPVNEDALDDEYEERPGMTDVDFDKIKVGKLKPGRGFVDLKGVVVADKIYRDKAKRTIEQLSAKLNKPVTEFKWTDETDWITVKYNQL